MPIHIIPGHSKLVDLFNWHKDTVDKTESRELSLIENYAPSIIAFGSSLFASVATRHLSDTRCVYQ